MSPALLLFALAADPAPPPATAGTGTLTVQVAGLHSDKGQVSISVHDKEDAFPTKPEKALRIAWVDIKDGQATFDFKDLPFGTYAVGMIHDENGNKKLDTNFLGIPTEGVGASNDARGHMGPPKFKDAKFVFDSAAKTIVVHVQY